MSITDNANAHDVALRMAEGRIRSLEAEVERLTADVLSGMSIAREADDTIERLTDHLRSRGEHIEYLRADAERLTADLAAARAQADAHYGALQACADSHEEQRQELVKARAERYGLAKALREIRDQEPLENALDPQWAGRIARAALAALPIPARESLAELKDAYLEGYEQHSVDSVYQNSPPNAEEAWETSDTKRFAALPPEEDDDA